MKSKNHVPGMILPFSLFFLLWVTGNTLGAQVTKSDLPELTGPYLGQEPPGKELKPFAREFFDSRFIKYHSCISFSSDGKEAYWQGMLNDETRNQAIFVSKLENGYWTAPMVSSFSISIKGCMDDSPFISPDGRRLFFVSSRPIENGGKPGEEHIWVVDRTNEGWSDPKPIPLILQSSDEEIHWRISVDRRNNLYFGTWQGEKGTSRTTGYIYVSKYEDDRYCKPERLPSTINREGAYNFCPQIAPDGSYMILNRDVLYCSFKKKDGTWTEAKRIDSVEWEESFVPSLSTDGKYLFLIRFLKEESRLFWIETSFIGDLRKEGLKNDN
ncbi:MAG: PD40 domain-containing protein [Bacteroidales bacterium]|nr:MAG: PD40 domain-containing protein [Bacteroidales bacterium]